MTPGGPATTEDLRFARGMLPLVSRTFAPAIEVLPASLAAPVRLSYLLCRVADTIEDTHAIPARIRSAWLFRFASLLSADADPKGAAALLAQEIAQGLDGGKPETRLVEGLPGLIRLLQSTDPIPRSSIVRWTRELALGMARFVRLEEGGSRGWTALATCEDLEAYEYYVAGTVGCLVYELIRAHIPRVNAELDARQRGLAVAFGLGLQGTNIIQDLSDDRARGWSYLPEEIARRHGTSTLLLGGSGQGEAAMRAVHEMASRAAANLEDGLEFILNLPRQAVRIRLFCLWPLLLALRTLTRLVSGPEVLQRRVRITRPEVRRLTREAVLRCLSNNALRRLYEREHRLLAAAMRANTRTGIPT